MPQPVVARQVQRLLRRACALDRHGRLAKQGSPLLELLYQFPGVGRQVVAVVGGDAVAAQGLAEAINGRPIQLEAGADHQLFITDGAAAFEEDQLAQRVKPLHTCLYPAHAARNGRGHGAGSAWRLEHTGTDHGPAGLVVMHFGGVDQGHIQRRVTADQAGSGGDSGGAGTDDDHFVVVGIGRGQQGRHGGKSCKSGYGAGRS